MVVKMKDLVRNEGEVTTIDELDKRGLIYFREAKKFYSPRAKKLVTKYFANIKGTTEGWEIGKLAYLSGTGRKVEVSN